MDPEGWKWYSQRRHNEPKLEKVCVLPESKPKKRKKEINEHYSLDCSIRKKDAWCFEY